MVETTEAVADIRSEIRAEGCRTRSGVGKMAWVQQKPVQLSFIAAGPIITAGSFAAFGFLDEFQSADYIGLFLISLLSSATLFLPAPGGVALIVAGAILNPFLVGLVAGSGKAFGELTGYALGYAGQSRVQRFRLYQRMKHYMHDHGGLVIFSIALIPNPLVDLAGIAAGAICYPIRRFLLFTWMGKVIHSTAIALAASYGWQAIIG